MAAALRIAGKDLRQRLRDRSAVMVAVVLPLALAFIYSTLFGGAAAPRAFEYGVVDLDRERRVHQRVAEPQQVGGVLREIVERQPVEVRHGRLQTGEGGVVERLELVHGAGQPLGVPLGLGGEAPLGERLEIGELGGKDRAHAGTRDLRSTPQVPKRTLPSVAAVADVAAVSADAALAIASGTAAAASNILRIRRKLRLLATLIIHPHVFD